MSEAPVRKVHYPDLLPCPVCGRPPDIDECGPPFGKLGWYANCYSLTPHEHNVGVNAETKSEARAAWNTEVVQQRRAALRVVHIREPSNV